MKTEQHTDTKTIEALAAALPLYDGETILWYREAAHGYELRVRTADGFESMHDVYTDPELEEKIDAAVEGGRDVCPYCAPDEPCALHVEAAEIIERRALRGMLDTQAAKAEKWRS